MKTLNLLLVFGLAPASLFAQEEAFETDRPSESISPTTVWKNHFQLETGFRREHGNTEDGRHDEYLYPSALLKYGLLKKLELRVLIEDEADYDYQPQKQKTGSGLEPVKVGIKYTLFDSKGIVPKTAIIARTDIPGWASPSFKGDFIAPLLRLAMESELTQKLKLVYNIGEEWEEDDVHGRFVYTLSPQYEVSKKFRVFAETYGYLSHYQTAEQTVDAGFLYQFTNNLQVDAFGGFGLTKLAPTDFIELGISLRLPK